MKVSKEQAALNRAKLVETAARLMRERGIDGVGVAEIGKAAGLTHGALYAHFPSKEALAAEALSFGLERGHKRLTAAREGRNPGFGELLDNYLSERSRNDIAEGCAMAASISEIARQDVSVSARFGEGFERMTKLIGAKLDPSLSDAQRRERALAVTVAMIGAISASRAVMKARPELGDEILRTMRHAVRVVAGETHKGKDA
ncbi:MAG TPA: helix-turn-helix domain-containing protein [Paraburkholderia sp.]|jgi:TetR/AcrR family transcriptional repressor of nem operon|nr:helix-turn-helix domain-containing protein [Paraburkholderia sp.]